MGAEKEGGMGKEVREDKEVGEVEREDKRLWKKVSTANISSRRT